MKFKDLKVGMKAQTIFGIVRITLIDCNLKAFVGKKEGEISTFWDSQINYPSTTKLNNWKGENYGI